MPAKKEEIRERGIRIGINQVVTYATLIPLFWFVAQPILVEALAEDIKDTVNQEVKKEVAPLNTAFIALLQTNIANTKRKIAQLEYKRDNPPDNDWTAQDAEELVNLEIQLASNEEALDALQAST